MKKDTFRVVTRGANGQLRIKDYGSTDKIMTMHTQIGVDDCSTDLDLRGLPVFRGLIGPMAEGKTVVRYESPEVFETLTKEWVAQPAEKRRRRRRKPVNDEVANVAASGTDAAPATNSEAKSGDMKIVNLLSTDANSEPVLNGEVTLDMNTLDLS